MRASPPWQFFGDTKTDIDAIHALWGGPKYIRLYNNDAAAWVPGSLYMVDFTAGALTAYGTPGAAIIAAATVAGQQKMIGIAVDAAAQGSTGRIQVYGKYVGANVLSGGGAAAPGEWLTGSLTTAGRLIKTETDVDEGGAQTFGLPVLGMCLTTPSANTADIFIFNRWGI